MKTGYLFTALCLLLAPVGRAEVDTLYSEPALDGEISQNNMFLNGDTTKFASTSYSDIMVGDWWQMVPDGNENWNRGYLSFNISTVSDTIQTVVMCIYQFESIGNSTSGIFPTLGSNCLIDHIAYGDTLDTLDWAAGDIGDSQTITSEFGNISSSPDTGWKTLDITSCLQADLAAGRSRTQFRIRFSFDTDHDWLSDHLSFYTGNSTINRPHLMISYITGVARIYDDSALASRTKFVRSYPNPFRTSISVTYNVGVPSMIQVAIYSLTGEKVRVLADQYNESGMHTIAWDGRDSNGKKLPNGIYYCCLQIGDKSITQRIVVVK
jgi:hypothetical protein